MTRCAPCGRAIDITTANNASWGPTTLYFHDECRAVYERRIRPRLRDAIVAVMRTWQRIPQEAR